MLVLSRKVDDTILIGDNIKIQVMQVKGNRIRIGIEAPTDVKILRGELANHSQVEKTSTAIELEIELEEEDSVQSTSH